MTLVLLTILAAVLVIAYFLGQRSTRHISYTVGFVIAGVAWAIALIVWIASIGEVPN